MRRIRIYFMFWWHYGAVGNDKFFRAFLAALAGLSFLAFLLELSGITHFSMLLPGQLASFSSAANLEKLAIALGLASAIMAGACMTFMGVLVPQSPDSSAPHSNLRARALIGMSVAFLASFIATLTFGILAAIAGIVTSSQEWAVMFAAFVLVITSSLLLIFVFIVLIPNRVDGNRRTARLGDKFGNVFSYAWVMFFLLLILLGQAAPEWGDRAGLPIMAAVFISLLQIAFPHGLCRWRLPEDGYLDLLNRMNSYAHRSFMLTILVTVVILCAVLVRPNLSDRILMFLIYLLLVLWSTGLLFLQVWVEGTRKMLRNPEFPIDFLAEYPKIAGLLKQTGEDAVLR